MLGFTIWQQLPYASLLFLVTRPGDISKKHLQASAECLNACLENMESKGIRRWYSWYPSNRVKSYSRFWQNNCPPMLARYSVSTEARVPKGRRSLWKVYREILDDRIWNFDIDIRVATLRPQLQTDSVDYGSNPEGSEGVFFKKKTGRDKKFRKNFTLCIMKLLGITQH